MVNIARRNLFQEKLRFAISSGGVALAVMLILVLNGFSVGMYRQISAYLDNSGSDLVVVQKGLRNFLGTNSLVPLSAVERVESVKGVKKATPILNAYTILDVQGRKVFSLMIGFDSSRGGGPREMAEGRSDIKNDELIFDKTMAERQHLKIGSQVDILGKEFTVVGLSGGTSTWMTGTFFVTYETASQLLTSRGMAGSLLVLADTAGSASEINQLRDRIKSEVSGLNVVTTDEMAANDIELFAGVFRGPLRFMALVAFLIGLLLVGVTIYTATVERLKEYGVLKAIGIKKRRLYLVVFEQALISSIIGALLGVGLAFLVVRVIKELAPQFLILIEWAYVLEVLPLAIAISILASYIPVRTVARIDPAIAFRRGA